MIPEIGHLSCIIAFSLLLITICTAKNYSWRSVLLIAEVHAFFVVIAFVALAISFVELDFSVQYVERNAHSGLPWWYRFCAVWGGHEGSLLLWALLQAGWTLSVAYTSTRWQETVRRQTILNLLGIQLALLLLLLFTSNPFWRWLPSFPLEGQDLNPLLQDLGFVIHPPFLYLGYVGCSVPLAIALAARQYAVSFSEYMSMLKPYLMSMWSFLTIGITLGSFWAYYELGWGGFWFWDPVENASFMPWLIATALIHFFRVGHSAILLLTQILSILLFTLSWIGTFIVRSGILISVHAFALDPKRGMAILGLFGGFCIWTIWVFLRSPAVTEEYPAMASPVGLMPSPTHYLYHPKIIFLAGLLILVACGTVALGTLYPLVLQVFNISTISVGPPYFNTIFAPLMGIAFLLMFALYKPSLKLCTMYCIALVAGCYFLREQMSVELSIIAWLGVFAGIRILTHLNFGSIAMRFAHCGIICTTLGIVVVSAFNEEYILTLRLNEIKKMGQYSIQLHELEDIRAGNFFGIRAFISIHGENGRRLLFEPEKRYFTARKIPLSETAIVSNGWEDWYIALGEPLQDDTWSIRVYRKPLVRAIWAGGFIMACAPLLGLIRFRKRKDHVRKTVFLS